MKEHKVWILKFDAPCKKVTSALAETETKSKDWLSKFDIVGSDKIHAFLFFSNLDCNLHF